MYGIVGVPAYLSVKGASSERLCLDHPFLKHHVVREIQRRRSSLVGKSAQTSAECNKLIMISRVPGYGHLEYLVLELLFDLITLLNESLGLLILFWD